MEIFNLLGRISIDTTQANRAIEDTTNQAEDAATEQQEAFSKIGAAAGILAKGVMAVGTVMAGAFIAATEGTREYRVSMGQLETAFETAGHSADSAKSTYTDLQAVLGDTGQATEAAQMLALLADNEEDLSTWTNICTGVFARLGEAVPLEELAASSSETAKSGVLTGGLVDALVQAGIKEEEFQEKLDACTTEQQRQDLIMNTLNGTYSEAATKYKEVNKDVLAAEKAQAKLTDAMAEVGAVGEPILTAIKEKVADMVAAAVPHIQSFIDKMKDLRTWVKNNQDTIDKWVAVIIGAGVAIGTFLLILNWGAIMTAAANALKTVRTAILAMNAALRANPIGLVVSLIAGLVAAFLYLWKNNEGFRTFWLNMWAKVKSTTSSVINTVKNKFNDLQAGLNRVKTIFSNIQKTISDKMESVRKKVKSVIDKIKGFFNISLKFKGIKMPSISLTMKKGKGLAQKAAELLGLSGIPKFSVKWNAQGGILTKPTIFGMAGNTFLGGGEAGDEAILPIDRLQAYIDQSVNSRNNDLLAGLEMQVSRLISFMQTYFPANYEIMLDTGILAGQLAPEMDNRLAEIYRHNKRGNTR